MQNPFAAVNPLHFRTTPQRNALRNGNASGGKTPSNAARQKQFRDARNAELNAYRQKTQALIDAVAAAAEAAGCAHLTDHLPHAPAEAAAELARRLEGRKLIVAKREVKR